MRRLQASRTLVVFYCLLVPLCSAGWSDRPAPEEPKLAAASDECERALRAVQAKGGLQGELYAAELGIAEAGDVLRKYVLRRDLDGKQRAAALVPLAGRVPPDAKLDLVLAARKRETPQLEAKLGQYDAAKPKDDPLGRYREAIAGGDAERGRQVFFARSDVSCVRCHKIGDSGGEVGPELTKIGKEKTPEYLLESVVLPSAQIAKEFQSVEIETVRGRILSGVIKQQDADQITLVTALGEPIFVPRDQVAEIFPARLSAMPADLVKNLSLWELRDLVAYLSSLK